MSITRATTVELEGRGAIRLSPVDHMATGGEASLYRKSGTAIKLYTDPGKMRRDGMVARIRELAQFHHDFVVAPRGLVTDSRGQPIGLWMDFIDASEPLSRVFTNDFRTREGFGNREATLLVDRMFQVMQFAHGRGATLVDPNELNWTTITARDGRDPRILDVDSWVPGGQLPQSVAIMPSIRDWHTKNLGQSSDQFALGVVTFQVYTGIHPYKGGLNGYKPSQLEQRMKDNASVFMPGVRLNAAVRDFGCIPAPLLGWYEAVFQNGERSDPPSPLYTGVTTPARQVRTARTVVTATGSLKYQRLFNESGDPAVRVYPCGVVQLRSGKLVDLAASRTISTASAASCEIVRTAGGWLKAEQIKGSGLRLEFIDARSLTATPLDTLLQGRGLVRYDNRLFVVTEQGLTEVSVKVFAKPILATGNTWRAMPNATRWFDGVGIQDSFGATFVFAPFGNDSCAQVRVRELDGLRPIAARASHRFVAVLCVDQAGAYRKVELTFDRGYQTYTVWQGGTDSAELNLALIPRGDAGVVAATVVQDGELVVFVPTSADLARGIQPTITRVKDKDVTTTMLLGNWDDRVVFIRDGQVWSVRMT